LLRIPTAELRDAFTTQTITVGKEDFVKPLDEENARRLRDSVAKGVYETLFSWLVRRINHLLQPDPGPLRGMLSRNPGRGSGDRSGGKGDGDGSDDGHDAGPTSDDPATMLSEIGVLDIFGFEDFGPEANGFEQLCINCANEQLQNYFVRHIFEWELSEYRSEGVAAVQVTFTDNKALVDLLLGKPIGVLSILDDNSKVPKATDATFATKLSKELRKRPGFLHDPLHPVGFGVAHYAGNVFYSAAGFLERNRDSDATLTSKLLRASSLNAADQIFSGSLATCSSAPRGATQAAAEIGGSRGGCGGDGGGGGGGLGYLGRISEELSPPRGGRHGGKTGAANGINDAVNNRSRLADGPKGSGDGGARKPQTVGSAFRESLGGLVQRINRATPHFVRCLKPNMDKSPDLFVDEVVAKQLRQVAILL
jgi:myosin heavy subunit